MKKSPASKKTASKKAAKAAPAKKTVAKAAPAKPTKVATSAGAVAALDHQEDPMSVAKIIEITSQSKKSFDDAVKQGIKKASKTVKNIQGAWVSEQKVVVQDGEVVNYRVTMRVTFILS